MPIKPENMGKYPGGSIKSPEWRAIRKRIGERSGWKCEACGAPHMTMIARGFYGDRDAYMLIDTCEVFCAESGLRITALRATSEFNARRVLRIVLTVAHRGLPAKLPLLLHVTRHADTNEVFEAVGFFMPVDTEGLEWRAMMHNRALTQLIRGAAADGACFAIAVPSEAASASPARPVVTFGAAAPIWVRVTSASVLSDEGWQAAGVAAETASRADVVSADLVGFSAAFAHGVAQSAPQGAVVNPLAIGRAGLLCAPRLSPADREHPLAHHARPLAVALTLRSTNSRELSAKSARPQIALEAIRRANLDARALSGDLEQITANYADVASRSFSGASHAVLYHFDEYEENCETDNLAHLCQRHHLRLDAKQHARNASATRRRRGGQLDMEDLL
jgi:hypothetical protein